jgi:peptide/nickel transport system permease protein
MRRPGFGVGAQIGAGALLVVILAVAAAPLYAPQNPLNLASLKLLDALSPPSLLQGFKKFPLGTDGQGRDVLSAILFAARLTFTTGALATLVAALIGLPFGLAAGLSGGAVDAVLTRLALAQRAVPSLLAALLADGVLRCLLPNSWLEAAAMPILVTAIALARWPHFACAARDVAHTQSGRDHMLAAKLSGLTPFDAALDHVLPNVLGPALGMAAITLVLAVADEATLSFLGVGFPPARPSLGTLIHMGSGLMLSGQWWVVLFPALALGIVLLIAHRLAASVRARFEPGSEDRVPV